MRDYIHVVDLADGHISALQKLDDSEIGKELIVFGPLPTYNIQAHSCVDMALVLGCEVYNLGTGKGTTVLEMVDAFEKASGMVNITSLLLFVSLVRESVCLLLIV